MKELYNIHRTYNSFAFLMKRHINRGIIHDIFEKGVMVLPLELLMQDAKGMIDEALMDVIRYMKFLKIAPARIVLETDSLSK